MKGSFKDYSFEDLLFKLSLYQRFNLDIKNYISKTTIVPWGNYNEIKINRHETHYSEDFQHLINFLRWEGKFYKYCPYCKRANSLQPSQYVMEEELADSMLESFRDDETEYIDPSINMADITMAIRLNLLLKNKTITKFVKCSHDPNHEFMFIYNLKVDTYKNILELKKIGQTPSMSDFARQNINKHQKLMNDLNCFEDFVMATHMYGSGTGVAAYTYLRRVFEKVVYRVFRDNQLELGKNESEFREMRMKDKIILLKDFLPNFLTSNNSNIYGLLSSGIHELSEEEATLMFPVLESAILIIFKEKQDKIDDDDLKQKTHNALNNFATKNNTKRNPKTESRL